MKKYIILLFIFSFTATKAQVSLLEADKNYDLYNYYSAINFYTKAYQEKPTLRAASGLANSYLLVKNYPKAEEWFGITTKISGSSATDQLNYAKVLQENAKYEAAKSQYETCLKMNPAQEKEIKEKYIPSCDSALVWVKKSSPYRVVNQSKWNTALSDWGPTPYKEGIVFTSDRNLLILDSNSHSKRAILRFRNSVLPNKNRSGWSGNGYFKLYQTSLGDDSVKQFIINTPSEYHIGPVSFNAKQDELFLALTEINTTVPLKRNRINTVNIETYYSHKDSVGHWEKLKSFPYNNVKEYSISDPFISPKSDTLYFSSNMPGGKGGSDIYYCLKKPDGSWSLPVNMEKINTGGNERTPYLDPSGKLFFASDGYLGFGGLDLYYVTSWGEIRNMGSPINSSKDDFAFMKDVKNGVQYFSSNRDGGEGMDDIYSSNVVEENVGFLIKVGDHVPILAKTKSDTLRLQGFILDSLTSKSIAGARIQLSGNGMTQTTLSDEKGHYLFILPNGHDYTLSAKSPHYTEGKANILEANIPPSGMVQQDVLINLEKFETKATYVLNNIYYNLNRWNIRPDASKRLNSLLKVLGKFPTMKIELSSHTDSRGSEEFNQTLSQHRAESAEAYLVSRGVSSDRIKAKGYGESKILNKCQNNIPCSEREHQINRRTEFKVLSQ